MKNTNVALEVEQQEYGIYNKRRWTIVNGRSSMEEEDSNVGEEEVQRLSSTREPSKWLVEERCDAKRRKCETTYDATIFFSMIPGSG